MLSVRRTALPAVFSALLAATCGGESTTGPSTGSITVSLHVTGEDAPAAVTVAVDEGETQSVPVDGSATFSDLPSGQHSVLVSGLPPNCTATTPNPAVVSLAGGETSTVDMSIGCAANVGSLEVSVWTNGVDLDPDGYVVAVPGVDSQLLPTTGSVMITGVPVGTNTVTITDVAPNCELLAGESFEVVVAYGETVTTGLSVSCYVSQGRIAFATNQFAFGGVFVIDPDGSDIQQIWEQREHVEHPVWSPDGQRIAFARVDLESSEIRMFRPDGTDTGQILRLPGQFYELSWSPDVSKLAFAWERDVPGSFDETEIAVVNADLTGLVNLSNNPGENDWSPVWSPDGSQIYFYYGGHGPAVVNADGTGLTLLTSEEAAALDPHWIPENLATFPDGFSQPVWSPDWTRLAMTSDPDFDLYVMNADGTDLRLVADRVYHSYANPSWSPDGERIVYWDNAGTRADILVVDIAGGSPTLIASEASNWTRADWGPDLR
jgi:hypothetical protein